jgi:cytochrome c peroxidase
MQHKLSFTSQELNGYELYKKNCSSCHTEPLFTKGSFKSNGLKPSIILNDYGRMRVTQNKEDSLLFKVPTLRNLSYTYPYMHDGRFKTLNEVINHYNKGGNYGFNVNPNVRKLNLTEKDIFDLIAFLNTLTDINEVRKQDN